jgi:N utilization substance protein A
MSEINAAIKQLCEEKNLDYKSVIAAVELALAAAYRKDYGERNQNIMVKFDPNTGASQIFDVKTVVENLPEEEEAEMLKNLYNPDKKESFREERSPREDRGETTARKNAPAVAASAEGTVPEAEEKKKFNPKTDLQLKEAAIMKHDAKVGDQIITDLPMPESYGRMAAQTAKQVIIQKIREMEREMIFSEFKGKEHEVVSGIVQRREGRLVFVDLGKAIGLLPAEEQIYSERYNPSDRVKVFIKEVREGHKGPEIILSRRSEEILRKVFYLEIPEIANGLVEIKVVAREAGSRAKVAIWTDADNVDPVGSCVGQRGSRVQTIISELGGEKIDIIEYSEDQEKFIANALAPAKVLSIELNNVEHRAIVKVSPDKLSLAIGKAGQNVRLAARLTGWKIDIIEATPVGEKKVIASDGEEVAAVGEPAVETVASPVEGEAAAEVALAGAAAEIASAEPTAETASEATAATESADSEPKKAAKPKKSKKAKKE